MLNFVKELKADDDDFGKQEFKLELVTIDQVFSCPNEKLKTYATAGKGKKRPVDGDLKAIIVQHKLLHFKQDSFSEGKKE